MRVIVPDREVVDPDELDVPTDEVLGTVARELDEVGYEHFTCPQSRARRLEEEPLAARGNREACERRSVEDVCLRRVDDVRRADHSLERKRVGTLGTVDKVDRRVDVCPCVDAEVEAADVAQLSSLERTHTLEPDFGISLPCDHALADRERDVEEPHRPILEEAHFRADDPTSIQGPGRCGPYTGRVVGKLAALVIAVAGIGAIVLAGFLVTDGQDGAESGSTAPAATVSAPRVEAEPPAPFLSGADPVTGKEVSLADFQGKPVVVNVWASWCAPCREEARDLARVAADHPEVVMLGIDYQDAVPAARRFYERYDWKHPSIFDRAGELAARLGLESLPTTVFLTPAHRESSRIVGPGNLAAFEQGLERAKRPS
jgi:thiol-disulfide isomerase/thioredoxin